MSTITPLPKRPRPLPDPKHRKQIFWQIWVPLCVSILVILFLAVLTSVSATTNNPTVTKWSNLSLIYMITPVLIVGFVFLAVLGGIVYGLARLLDILPVYTRIVQGFFRQMVVFFRTWSDKTIQPILAIKSWWAGFESALKHFGL